MLRNRAWLRRAVDSINLCLFAGHEIPCKVGWQRWGRFHDCYGVAVPETGEIWLHRALAYPAVPDFMVVYTLYHELLHLRFGHAHDERFALAEKQFPHFAEAIRWDAYNFDDVVRTAARPAWSLIR